jgi:primosomal protein N' (replication factor Y)
VFACIADMDAFATHEERIRRMLRYPPFARLVLLRCEGVDRAVTFGAANTLTKELRAASAAFPLVDVLGPATAPLARLVGRWRYQIVLRGRDLRAFRRFLEASHGTWKVPQGVRLLVDVDPRSLG